MENRMRGYAIPILAAAALAAAALAGCAGFGAGAAAEAEDIAAAALEYGVSRQAELSDGGEAALLEDAAPRGLELEALARDLDPAASGSFVDNGDGTVSLVSSYSTGDGLLVETRVTRTKKPAGDDPLWEGRSELAGEGTLVRTVEGVTVADLDIAIVWRKAADGAVYRASMTRTGESVGPYAGLRASTSVEWDEEGRLFRRVVAWFRLGEDLALRSLVFTPELDPDTGEALLNPDGEAILRVVSPERDGWALVVDRRAPRVVEWYRADGVLALRVTHERVEGLPGVSVTREYFDAAGAPLRTVTGSMRMVANADGSLTLVRQVGSRRVATTVAETEEGLALTRNGSTWTVRTNADGSLDLTGPDGSSWHVEYAADGSPVVTGA